MQLSGNMRHCQRGVGLIEVLIAVLVLSFGMLGMVGLQTWALRNNQSALERGMATVQTHSIADALRADRENARNGIWNIAIDAATPAGTTTFRDVSIANWRAGLQQALNPTATGSIECNGARCTITVRWNDARAAASAQGAVADQTIVTQVEL